MRLMGVLSRTGWLRQFGIRYFLSVLPMGIQPFPQRCPSLGCVNCPYNVGFLWWRFAGNHRSLGLLAGVRDYRALPLPDFESPSNHKYDTIDYFEIDRHFGDKDTFRQLVKEAHARGMKIMLDAVFNHIGAHSKQWQDVRERGADSPYTDWFHIYKYPVVDPLTPGAVHREQGLSYEMFAFEVACLSSTPRTQKCSVTS